MAFFDQLSQKLTQTSQDAVKKTKDMAEIVRLNSAISDENKKIEAAYREIGKLYYENCAGQENPLFQTAVGQIRQSEHAVQEMRDTIRRLKGIRACPSCGCDLPAGTVFCNNCGAKIPEPPAPSVPADSVLCPACGSPNPKDMSFCSNCGAKISVPIAPPPPPAPSVPAGSAICPACGNPMSGNMTFCTNCGARLTPPEASVPAQPPQGPEF